MLDRSAFLMQQHLHLRLLLFCLLPLVALAQSSARKPGAYSPQARLQRAQNFLDQQRIPEALEELRKALEVRPDPELQFQVGKLLRTLAESRFAALSEAAPGSAALRELAGDRHERMGQFAEALEEYRRAARLEPHRPGLHFRKGNVLWKMRDFDAAIPELEAELARSPHHGMANLRLGQARISSGQEDQALVPLESAVAAMPNLTEARRDLGKVYRKLGRNQDARREWELVATAKAGDEQIHYLLAALYRDLGENELASRSLERHRSMLNQRRAQAGKE